jgi:hypothetical protein
LPNLFNQLTTQTSPNTTEIADTAEPGTVLDRLVADKLAQNTLERRLREQAPSTLKTAYENLDLGSRQAQIAADAASQS